MARPSSAHSRQILGIEFFIGTAEEAVEAGLGGGLLVVPAAPALALLATDSGYREALLHCDLAIPDSGFMTLIWNLLNADRIARISGLEYLRLFLPKVKSQGLSTFWIMPNTSSMNRNLAWLDSQGFRLSPEDCYIAPQYDPLNVEDAELLEIVKKRSPSHVIVALGGGIQEKLGHYLKKNLSARPGIHCIGAAVAFLSGDQVRIPTWADRFYLGWLLRCLRDPSRFVPRYWRALGLLPLLLKYRDQLPELKAH